MVITVEHSLEITSSQEHTREKAAVYRVAAAINTKCNDVSNQQDATTFSFINLLINLFKSALHVSGDKFAHPQEHFF